jgi:hypothetical protein
MAGGTDVSGAADHALHHNVIPALVFSYTLMV